MWTNSISHLHELAAAGGIVFLVAFVSWTKVALGAAVAIAAVFFPHATSDKASGKGSLTLAGFNITLSGSLRVGVLLAGLMIIAYEGIGAKLQSEKFTAAAKSAATEMGELLGGAKTKKPAYDGFNARQRVEKLTAVRNSLKAMQASKPDARVAATLESIEMLLQNNVISAEFDKILQRKTDEMLPKRDSTPVHKKP
jgi:hypothetical protein